MVRCLTFCLVIFFLSITSLPLLAEKEMPPVPVEAMHPKKEKILDTIETTGVLKSQSSIWITSETPGRITHIFFKEGAKVEKGAKLFQLDDALLQAELKQAQARLDNAKAQYDRFESLVKTGAGNISQRDEAFAKLKVEAAQISYLEAKLKQMTIIAPFEGVLGLSTVEVGDYISPAEKLINLEAIDTLKVDFNIPETFLNQMQLNQSIIVHFDGIPDTKFQGKVIAINPQIETDSHSITLRGLIDNPDLKLRPGLFVKVELVLREHPNALIVAESAIQLSKDTSYVYAIENGLVKKLPIKIGKRMPGWVEVLEGIKETDLIILSGQNKLYEGAKVIHTQP